MEVHFKPETESRLAELASKSGRATDDLVEDALAGYLAEVAEVREMLDGRYDEIKSGRVKPIDGEAFFDNLRQRENERLAQRKLKRPPTRGLSCPPGAPSDITGIWEFIAEGNPDAAGRVREDILDAIRRLVPFPRQGHQRTDLTSRPLRFLSVRNYLI